MSKSKSKLIDVLAKRLLAFPLLRLLSISILNFLFLNKQFKRYFEKIIFNPYFIPSVKEEQIKEQAQSLLKELGDIQNKTILELGPGGDCLLACHLLKAGAKKIILLDVENYIHVPSTEKIKYRSIYPEVFDKNDNLNSEKIQTISYREDGTIPLNKESVDIIYSMAVFEHVNKANALLLEIQRILTPSGISYHQIDFRDHVFQQSSLLFLFFPNWLFNLLFSQTGMWTNRIRYSQWKKMFKENNFILIKEKTTTEKIEAFNQSHIRKLKSTLSIDDIITTGGAFLIKK